VIHNKAATKAKQLQHHTYNIIALQCTMKVNSNMFKYLQGRETSQP